MSKSQLPRPKSSISVFLTNLRLLDLDKRPDWPSTSPQLLLGKDGPKNQKNRIQFIEWALYRLFELWDPEETSNVSAIFSYVRTIRIKLLICVQRLQSFFPPILTLQSINLRTALFKWLIDLKKDGTLRKEVTIRKTMLDECKGEKFDEVLGAFSTLVLQRFFEAEQNLHPTRARRLVLAQRLTSEEQQSLLPLAIAHRSALSALLRKKSLLRLKYREFKTTLDAKELEIRSKAKNLEVSKASEKGVGPTENLRKLKDYFDRHWQGDPRWIDEIFGQGKEGTNDPLFDTPFSDSWTRLTDSTVDQPAPKQQGLLSQLEERVAAQEARLKQWKRFREDLGITSTKVENVIQKKTHNQVDDLKFSSRVELDLELGNTREEVGQDSATQESISFVVNEYQGLMDSMRRELAAVDSLKHGSDHDSTAAPSKQLGTEGLRQLSSSMRLEVAKRGYPESTNLPVKANSRTDRRRNYDFKTKRTGTDSDQEYSDLGELGRILSIPEPEGPLKRLGVPERFPDRESEKRKDIFSNPSKNPVVPFKFAHSLEVISSSEDILAFSSKSGSTISGQEDKASTDLDEEEILAQPIVRSTNEAESPVKPKLSLLERTRQSMALVKLEEKDTLPEAATAESTSVASVAENIVPSSDAPAKRRETLLERTRQSMSLIPPKPPPQKGIEQRRTSKIYPTNQFETPGKQQSRQNDEESTPPESLFEQDANYASVFKSRPKVALSPTATSVMRHDELDDIIEWKSSEDDDDDGAFARGSNSSPSVRAKERNKRF